MGLSPADSCRRSVRKYDGSRMERRRNSFCDRWSVDILAGRKETLPYSITGLTGFEELNEYSIFDAVFDYES